MTRPSRRSVIVGAVAGAGLAACGQNAAPVDDQGRVRLRLVLDGPAGAIHGAYYQAVASDLFARRNLNVEIIPGGPDVNPPELLASGSVELALGADGFSALSLIASGAPVRAVAAYFQKDTHAILTRAGVTLEAPADLADRAVATDQADAATVWPVVANLYGLSVDQGEMSPTDTGPAVLPGDDDEAAALIDLRDGPPPAEASVMLLGDHDYPAYGGLLLAPNGFTRDNAASLRAFITGVAEGWRDYLGGDPARADALILAANPAATQATLTATRRMLIDNQIVQGGEAAIRGIGVMNEERWRAFATAAIRAEVYPEGLNWRDAFTLDYLPGRS
jgi:NitT/TauT family transport system substrate-binding protein